MAVVNLNLSLEQVLEFIKSLPQEYKKAAFEQLKTEYNPNLINELESSLYVEEEINYQKEVSNLYTEFLSKSILIKISELNINLLDTTNSKEKIENDFKALILLYEEIGNKYEQIIHQTKEIKDASQIKKYLENIISIANFYLEKNKIQFEEETAFLESLSNEIENIEELTQDIQLKFFDIPSKTSIHEILKRI